EQRRPADLFSNLVGVKQGHLTRPFDSKPKTAKEFFEPLLDVAIFRDSTERLGDAQKRFRDVLEEHGQKLAAIAERVRLLDDSAGRVPLKEAELEALARAVEKSRKQKEEADKAKQVVEQKQAAFNAAKTTLEESKNQLRLARQQRES